MPTASPNDNSAPRRWASIPAAAEYLGVCIRTIRQMIQDGKIRRYGSSSRLVRVDLNEIDAAMELSR
jgi:excisionase family DNA binding protein